MIISKDIELPDRCPSGCLGHRDLMGYCFRCPIMLCTPSEGMAPIMDGNEYRRDWALAWKEWFESGMVGIPDLKPD